MFDEQFTAAVTKDKNLFSMPEYSLITVYDDNFFVRNDYDILSQGQRQYLIHFFTKHGFTQKTGKTLANQAYTVHFPTPSANLAVSAFDNKYLHYDSHHQYCITPTQFAEVLFYDHKKVGYYPTIARIKALIETCPFNIEWLRDISYHSEIEQITKNTFPELMDYQKQVIAAKFKRKRAL
ncbi:hypothetical protein [Paraferrimonas sp. SM1919]|uniref:hypothetical protein n=1 Tax=Paraferrimonas sp. SM1919 TaxID=2662263 RepID=UPI0013D2EAE0|nr:hypothetical protein [Paraferrimonas sp. SM1919]